MTDRVAGLTFESVYKGIDLIIKQNSTIVPNIVGHGGIGKSQLVRDLAHNNGYGYFEITCSLLQPGDLTMPVPKENSIEYYLNPQVQNAIDQANANPDSKVLLFLDEFNRPIAMVQNEIMNLVLQRNLMGHTLPDNVVIITAENPSSNVEGFEQTSYSTNARDMAINDRTMRIRMGANLDHWLSSFAYGSHPSQRNKPMIHPLISEFLEAEGRQYFILLDETRDKNPTPRAYERLSTLFYNYEDAGIDIQNMQDDALTEFLVEGIEGSIGEEAGQILLTFLQNHQGDYIKPKEVVEADGSHVSSDLLTRYQLMPSIRKKRIIEDLTDYLVSNKDLLSDNDLITRYVDLLMETEPDQIYVMVEAMEKAEASSPLALLASQVQQDSRFVDRAFAMTMAITSPGNN